MAELFSYERCVSLGDMMSILGYFEKYFAISYSQNIYHYTDITGFLGIIKNREFWVSHIHFMNDRREYVEGKDRSKRIITAMLNTHAEQENEILATVLKHLDNEVSLGIFPISSKDVFSLSFSGNRDSLDMWRGYGSKSGIAIGFDTELSSLRLPGLSVMRKEQYADELIKQGTVPEQLMPGKGRRLFVKNIIYDPEKMDAVITEAIKMGIDRFNFMDKNAHYGAIESAAECIVATLFALFPFMKNNGFKNEEECRMVENFGSNRDVPLDIHYRERNGIMLPFIKYVILDMDCRPLKQWPISEIVVGPGLRQQMLADSIKYFLNQQGMPELSEKVVCSSIPFVPHN